MKLAVLAALMPLLNVPAQAAENRVENWRDDLNLVQSVYSQKGSAVDALRGISTRGQKDFEKLYPNFKEQIGAVEAEVPHLSDTEITLRLMKVIASANVAHNIVEMPSSGEFAFRLPLTFTWYADGLAVTGTGGRFVEALGTRVVKIGGRTPEEILALAAPYIAHENNMWLRHESREFLRHRAVLQQLGLVGANGSVQFVLAKPGGSPFTLDVPSGDDTLTDAARQRVPQSPLRRRGGTLYWHTYLSESRTLFIQYNACVQDAKLPFADFARQVLADADSKPVKRVVIDLRANGGGNSRIINPLKSGLREQLGKVGQVYVLIGPGTFSAGADNAIELRRELHAKLVGEPTGARPGSYGEVKYINLPHSKLVVQYTSKWFGSRNDESETLAPDISAPEVLDGALAGRDAAMEKALAQ